jgi:hypothetical protein
MTGPRRRSTGHRTLAAAVGGTTVAAVALAALWTIVGPTGLTAEVLMYSLAIPPMSTVGTLLAIRVPRNSIGWLLLVAAVFVAVQLLALVYAETSRITAGGSWPGTSIAVWLYANLEFVPSLIMVSGIPLVFPDGRLLSPRWRWLAGLVVATGISGVLGWFRVGLIPYQTVENPFGVALLEPLLDFLNSPLYQLAEVLVFVGVIASVAIRFRRGTSIERQQLKWLIAVTAVAGIAWSGSAVASAVGATTVVTVLWISGLLALFTLPVAIGIAVLRYRLYEIDRIISRTIGWALVTGLLAVVFAAGVVALQTTLGEVTQGNTIAVALSTLAVAALFQPLRRRVQLAVDRRFDRARYDAQRTVDAFAERLRDEVELDAVEADLRGTITGSVMPSSYGLWLRRPALQRRTIDGP